MKWFAALLLVVIVGGIALVTIKFRTPELPKDVTDKVVKLKSDLEAGVSAATFAEHVSDAKSAAKDIPKTERGKALLNAIDGYEEIAHSLNFLEGYNSEPKPYDSVKSVETRESVVKTLRDGIRKKRAECDANLAFATGETSTAPSSTRS